MIKMSMKLRRKMKEHSENFNRVRKYVNNQPLLKSKVTEIKNTLDGINSRLDDTEEWISELGYRVVE